MPAPYKNNKRFSFEYIKNDIEANQVALTKWILATDLVIDKLFRDDFKISFEKIHRKNVISPR